MRSLLFLVALASIGIACSWDYPIWIPRTPTADPLYRFRKGELAGYINSKGKIKIPASLKSFGNSGEEFHDGLLNSFANRGEYIGPTGKKAINAGLHIGNDFSEGIAAAIVDGPCIHVPDGPCGSMSLSILGGSPQSNASRPHLPSCQFALISKDGNVIGNKRFDAVRPFSEGLAPAQIGGLWGFIDKAGETVIAPTWQDAHPFSNSLARVRLDGKFGFINKSGILVIPLLYQDAENFSDNRAPVSGDAGSYWYIDSTGTRAFPGNFQLASPFFKGLAHVQLKTRRKTTYAYINTNGRTVFKYEDGTATDR